MRHLCPSGVSGLTVGLLVLLLVLLLCSVASILKIQKRRWRFEAHGPGSFEAGMTSYLRVIEIIIGLATASIVLLGSSSALRVAGQLPGRYGSPMVLLAMSVIYLVLFIAMFVYIYEQTKHKPEFYTHHKYRLLTVLGFSGLLCFALGFGWLVYAFVY